MADVDDAGDFGILKCGREIRLQPGALSRDELYERNSVEIDGCARTGDAMADINAGFAAMRQGVGVRYVVTFE